MCFAINFGLWSSQFRDLMLDCHQYTVIHYVPLSLFESTPLWNSLADTVGLLRWRRKFACRDALRGDQVRTNPMRLFMWEFASAVWVCVPFAERVGVSPLGILRALNLGRKWALIWCRRENPKQPRSKTRIWCSMDELKLNFGN